MEEDHSDSEPKGILKKEKTRERPAKKKFDFELNSRTIFVGNLPTTFDHKSVAKLFKECGTVESARIRSIVPDKEKLAPKVALITKRLHPKVNSFNAYVVFKTNENDECVKKALAMNGKLIDKHHIRVDRAQRPKAKKETLTSRKKSVFIGNMRFDIRDDELINHFNAKVGPVNYVRIVRDSATGLGKGFGFVVFNERASVKKALELNDTQFKGRSLRVKKVEEDDKSNKKSKSKGAAPLPAGGGEQAVTYGEKPRKKGKVVAGGDSFKKKANAVASGGESLKKRVNPVARDKFRKKAGGEKFKKNSKFAERKPRMRSRVGDHQKPKKRGK